MIHRALIRSALAATLVIAGACSKTPDCELHQPSAGVFFSVHGLGDGVNLQGFRLIATLGGDPPQTRTLDISPQEAEYEDGKGRFQIVFGSSAETALYSAGTSLDVEVQAIDDKGQILATSGLMQRNLSLDGCNFFDLELHPPGSGGDGGVGEGGPPPQIPPITQLADKALTLPAQAEALAVCQLIGDQNSPKEVIIGIPSANQPSRGAVFVLDGGQLAGSAPDLDSSILRIDGAQSGDRLGAAVLCKDLDNDGHDDLVIGAPGADGERGRAYVLYGRAHTGSNHHDLATAPADLTLIAPFEARGLGKSFAALRGWTDHGGRSLAIGAPNTRDNTGSMYLLLDEGQRTSGVVNLEGLVQRGNLSGSAPSERHGISVAASDELIAFGSTAGQVQVYQLNNTGTWSPAAQPPKPRSTPSSFGATVALYGNTLLVAAPGENKVFVYAYDGSQWTLEATILPPTGATYTNFGKQLAVHSGAALIASDGAVFCVSGSATWPGVATKLSVPSNFTPGAVAVYSEGGSWRAVVGDPDKNKVYSYYDTSCSPSASMQTLQGASPQDRFGEAVALRGEALYVGAPKAAGIGATTTGRVEIYRWEGTDSRWRSQGFIAPPAGGSGDRFGSALAIGEAHLLVGAKGASVGGLSSAGVAYLYYQHPDNLMEFSLRARLHGDTPAADGGFASGLAFADRQGHLSIVATGPGDSQNKGSAHLFGQSDPRVLPYLGEQANSLLAHALAAGPVSDAGGDDLFMASPGATFSGHEGAVLGLRATKPDHVESLRVLRAAGGDYSLVIWGKADEGFGNSLAVGPVDDSHRSELLIGAPQRAAGGAVYLLSGLHTHLVEGAVNYLQMSNDLDYQGLFISPEQGASLGAQVHLVDDPNAQRVDPLFAATGRNEERGAVYLLKRQDSYNGQPLDVTDKSLQQAQAAGVAQDEHLGTVLASGDIDNKGRPYLLIANANNTLYVVQR